jgi:hypothetical protein
METRTESKPKRPNKPMVDRTLAHSTLKCFRCHQKADVVDLNLYRESAQCSICGFPNDLVKAVERAK